MTTAPPPVTHLPGHDRWKREYYDRRAAEYDATITDGLDEVTTAALAEESAALDRVLAALPPAPTLDVGCGTGGLTRHLPGQVVALDQSQGMLRIARTLRDAPGHHPRIQQ